jgi:predicted NBD/HSP70 family sugar kinase
VCLNGQPLQRDLEQALGRALRLANDADCFALSEATDGAAAGARSVFGVIVGTGTGGGIVIDGRLLAGPNAIAGEWGHNPLPWPRADELPGPACYCGKHGCIETFLSGPGLARDYQHVTGQPLSAEAIAAHAAQGEANAQTALQRYTDRLARGLASVINVLDPEVIVLGGGMSNIAALYQDVPAIWGSYVFSDHVATRLVPAKYGAASGVRGAAWLWPADQHS